MDRDGVADADYALARMVLVEVGMFERQLVRWMAEMKTVREQIFTEITDAWMQQYTPRISALYNITREPLLQNTTRDHMPLLACMMPELLGIERLPRPPLWFRSFAKESTTHSLGFATARPFEPGGRIFDSPSHAALRGRTNMMAYFHGASSERCNLLDERWFDRSVADRREMPLEFPRLYWLAREAILRMAASTPSDAMDPLLEFLQTPETPSPSKKTLARYAAALAEAGGERYLDFARDFLHEKDRYHRANPGYAVLFREPALYQAAVLPRLAQFLADLVRSTGSIRGAAIGILRHPARFRMGGGQAPHSGMMPFGVDDNRRFRDGASPAPVVRSNGPCRRIIVPQISIDIFAGCLWTIAAARQAVDLAWLLPMCAQALEREDVAPFNRLVTTVGLI